MPSIPFADWLCFMSKTPQFILMWKATGIQTSTYHLCLAMLLIIIFHLLATYYFGHIFMIGSLNRGSWRKQQHRSLWIHPITFPCLLWTKTTPPNITHSQVLLPCCFYHHFLPPCAWQSGPRMTIRQRRAISIPVSIIHLYQRIKYTLQSWHLPLFILDTHCN